MKYDILYRPVYSLLSVDLAAGESIGAEAGAMVSMTSGITLQTSAKGGIFSSLKRSVLGGESFFQNTFTGPGTVMFSPSYMGDVEHIAMSGEWFLRSGAYLASTPGLTIDTSFQGLKGAVSGEGNFFLRIAGTGDLFISSFGAIHEISLKDGEEIRVDTGNLVALQEGVTYTVEKVGDLKSTMLSGEGLVLRLKGPGRIFIQSRNVQTFIGWLTPMIPRTSN
jgi:uncharacterized protein (TIGR00266 family)